MMVTRLHNASPRNHDGPPCGQPPTFPVPPNFRLAAAAFAVLSAVLLPVLSPMFAVANEAAPPDRLAQRPPERPSRRATGEATGKAGARATDDLLNDIPEIDARKRTERFSDAEDQKRGRAAAKDGSTAPPGPGRDEGEDIGRGRAAGGSEPRRGGPSLRELTDKMRQVQARIDRHDLSSATQTRQREIVEELDRLISALESQQGQAGGRGSRAGGSPQRDPASNADRSSAATADSPGDGEQQGEPEPGSQKGTPRPSDRGVANAERKQDADGGPPSNAARQRMKSVWGQLPERVRQQMLNLAPDLFLPKYERMIEEYYQRLSESE